ncbi:MAG TPA: DUF1778 domain-containing protein [Candidatus Nanopelagicales bacterium]|nr:DUF1778 domain-containing protein [Candidatus Nanopelagicales bacterium]
MANDVITMRTDAARKQRLREAAELNNQNLTTFILDAAEAQAERVLDHARFTETTAEFFDAFDDLLTGDAIPAMTEAATHLANVVDQRD